MISTFRLDLIGKQVISVEWDADGLGLQLSDGWKIAIWARARLEGSQGNQEDLQQLLGSTLQAFEGDQVSETLEFSNGSRLVVALDAADAPTELMALWGPDNLIVVWR